MSLLFDRKYRIRFGQPGAAGREISGLRIAFAIERDSSSESNAATIQIWNLSETSRAEILRSGATVSLEAGYGRELGMIFQGNDFKVNIRRELPDVVTEIKTQDGGFQLRSNIVNIGFELGSSIRDVVSQIMGTFQDLTTNAKEILTVPADQLSEGWIASGTAKKVLDDLLKPRGIQWSVQDGEIRLVADDKTSNDGAVRLSAGTVTLKGTGLVGSPTKTEDGIIVTSLLNPKIRPYRQIVVESRDIDGIYKVDKVTHRGDSWGGDWYTVAECRST